MSKHYSDDEIIERIVNVGDSKDSYEWLADLVQQRFQQKDSVRRLLHARLSVAETALGQMYLTELMQEELD